jgi:zinc transport system substrate-binding protein
MVLAAAFVSSAGCRNRQGIEEPEPEIITRNIVTSDTLVSSMVVSLLPPSGTRVTALLPPGQCPGHYDIKLSDIEKVNFADVIISMKGLPFMVRADLDENRILILDSKERNGMVPDTHITLLNALANELAKHYPEDAPEIEARHEEAVEEIFRGAMQLQERLVRSGVVAMPVLASSMQKEILEWMGFRVVGEYGRPESMSAKEISRLSQIADNRNIVMVVDNLQSGPDAGRGIAEAQKVPHVVLSNFPLEDGYMNALRTNVDLILDAVSVLR